mgnify:CR=1 FL=1
MFTEVLTFSLHHYSLEIYVNGTTEPLDNVELLLNHLTKKLEPFCKTSHFITLHKFYTWNWCFNPIGAVFYIIYEGTLALSHCDLVCDVLFERFHGSIEI